MSWSSHCWHFSSLSLCIFAATGESRTHCALDQRTHERIKLLHVFVVMCITDLFDVFGASAVSPNNIGDRVRRETNSSSKCRGKRQKITAFGRYIQLEWRCEKHKKNNIVKLLIRCQANLVTSLDSNQHCVANVTIVARLRQHFLSHNPQTNHIAVNEWVNNNSTRMKRTSIKWSTSCTVDEQTI